MSKSGSHKVNRALNRIEYEERYKKNALKIIYDSGDDLRIYGDSIYCGNPQKLLCTIVNNKHMWYEIWCAVLRLYKGVVVPHSLNRSK